MVKIFYKHIALGSIKIPISVKIYTGGGRTDWHMISTSLECAWHPCGTALVLRDTEHCLAQSPALLHVPTCSPWPLRQWSLLWPLQPHCSCRVWQLVCIPAPCQPMAWLPQGCCWHQAATLDMKWQFINNHSWIWITFFVFDFFYLTTLFQIFNRFPFYNLDCTVSLLWLLDQLHVKEACKKNFQTNCCKFGTH